MVEELKDLKDYKREMDFQTLYETRQDVATLNKEFIEIKISLATHFAEDKSRGEKIDKIVAAIEGNGKPGVLQDIVTLYRYVAYVVGGAAVVGIGWSIIVFIVPLFVK